MHMNRRNGASFYQFPSLSRRDGVVHAVFTRKGGVSPPPFDSLNVSFGVGDADENILANRRIMAECLDHDAIAFVDQVHGDHAAVFKKADGRPPEAAASEKQNADAMVTDIPGLMLAIQTADCQAVLLYDPVKRVVANIHSGWRSSIQNIIGRTVRTMEEAFGSRPADMIAGVGPSLGPCCAEFIHYKKEIPEAYWPYKDENHHFDFWAVSRRQLVDAGVSEAHVHIGGLCTKCNASDFFSYRGEGVTGRFAAVIGLKGNRP